MSEPVLELRSIRKTYPGVTALDDVTLTVKPGEVLGLIGENGAGKSTLMKIVGGVVAPTSGTILIGGVERTDLTVKDSQEAGIAFVHQELNLFDNLDVAANVLIGREPRWGGPLKLVNKPALRAQVTALLTRLGMEFGADDLVENLSIAQRQMVEIAKALSLNARVIIMDEPTSSLTLPETERLLKVVADLRADGVSIIYISHRLAEVKACADRVAVLRDGKLVGELERDSVTHDRMIRLMIGRDLKALYVPPKGPAGAGGLLVRDLVTTAHPEEKVSFEVRPGEIVGMAGLIGSGRTELVETIFGVNPPLSGDVLLDGEPVRVRRVNDAIKQGIYLAPEDRKRSGLFLDFSIVKNITLPDLYRFAKALLIDGRREHDVAETQSTRLAIKAPNVDTLAGALSGGNQQKIVLGKWLSMRPKVMIFDEPTRGIDVGAKSEIYTIMRELADAGVAILMISSDLEEVIGVSDRVIVMHEGSLSGHLDRAAFSEHNVMLLATGGDVEGNVRADA